MVGTLVNFTERPEETRIDYSGYLYSVNPQTQRKHFSVVKNPRRMYLERGPWKFPFNTNIYQARFYSPELQGQDLQAFLVRLRTRVDPEWKFILQEGNLRTIQGIVYLIYPGFSVIENAIESLFTLIQEDYDLLVGESTLYPVEKTYRFGKAGDAIRLERMNFYSRFDTHSKYLYYNC